jgi:type IV pilus assembly protein PilC
MLTVHLHLLFRSGLQLHDALDVLSRQEEKQPALVAHGLAQDLAKGSRFSEALQKQPNSFPDSYVRVVEVGEESGTITQALQQLAEGLEKQTQIRESLKSSLVYPAFLLAGCGGLIFVMLYFLFPMVISVTSGAGVEPPLLTRWVMRFTQPWIGALLVGLFVVATTVVSLLLKNERFAPRLRAGLERYTPIGNFLVKLWVLESTRQLALLVSSGVDIVKGLTLAGRSASGSVLVTQAYEEIVQDVMLGSSMSECFGRYYFFPPMLVSMLAVSEEAGGTSEMLNYFCHSLEEDLDLKLKSFTAALEPLMLAFLGTIVGVLLVAAFLPIYNLVQV